MQPLCDQVTTKGTPCRKRAMANSTRCAFHLGKAGRESILTPELAARLETMLRAGNYIEVACRAVGISGEAFRKWMRRGRAGEQQFAEFLGRMERALAEGEVRNVARIAAATQDSWQAAAWMLERQYPERWGRASTRVRLPDRPPEELPDAPAAAAEHDPFAEVDELAAKRRTRSGF
jgi:hypothetical protein